MNNLTIQRRAIHNMTNGVSNSESKKGLAFSIEAIIAIGILVLAIAGMFTSLPLTKVSSEKYSAYAALAEIYDSGELRILVDAENTIGIQDHLKPWIDDFELEICAPGCAGPTRSGAIALDWFVSGSLSVDPKRLRVYVFQ